QRLAAPLLPDDELERHLEQLENSNYLAELWRTLLWYEQQLLRANELVETIAKDAGCTPVSVPQRAQILRTVFFKFFAADMQAQLGQMIRQATLANKVIESLEPQ